MKIPNLQQIKGAIPLTDLTKDQVKELQQVLARLSYDTGKVDGLLGKKTISAYKQFKKDNYQAYPNLIGSGTISIFLKEVDYDESNPVDRIIKECKLQGLNQKEQIAYVLATAQHETNNTYKPVKEAYWLSENWRKVNLRYYPYYGRGVVQITWKYNYQYYKDLIGVDFVSQPDLMLRSEYAYYILVHGMKNGTFNRRGKGLAYYINDSKVDYIEARRTVNILDKAEHIAMLAKQWENKIPEG